MLDQARFSLGDRVKLVADERQMIRIHPNQMALTYEIIRIVPGERDGEAIYHIKSDREPHMRAVDEKHLAQA
ncbi:hypothetical protein [Salinarimonas ramus]|uniref:Uncharacterized protein n=1 Tax=Salinarimonas ramus TaxID=690164 RepID=A0A917V2N1_9HYPH|nr:hypothetical protein [Salinarimonas ramus]GGK23044.1 hypothetical protein GCM10011322_07240 [Salinarimonas ramus]